MDRSGSPPTMTTPSAASCVSFRSPARFGPLDHGRWRDYPIVAQGFAGANPAIDGTAAARAELPERGKEVSEGLEMASGNFVSFADHDGNRWSPHGIPRQESEAIGGAEDSGWAELGAASSNAELKHGPPWCWRRRVPKYVPNSAIMTCENRTELEGASSKTRLLQGKWGTCNDPIQLS